jgi:hypothetical protein
MNKQRVLLESAIPGQERRMADVVICTCGCRAFHIWQIVGHKHAHFQCTACDTSFCPLGDDCDAEMEDADEQSNAR